MYLLEEYWDPEKMHSFHSRPGEEPWNSLINTVYVYNILGWSSFPSIRPVIRPVIHPSKFLIPEEEDDGGLHSVLRSGVPTSQIILLIDRSLFVMPGYFDSRLGGLLLLVSHLFAVPISIWRFLTLKKCV